MEMIWPVDSRPISNDLKFLMFYIDVDILFTDKEMEKRVEESAQRVAEVKRRLEEQNGRLLVSRGALENGRRQRILNQNHKLFQVNP